MNNTELRVLYSSNSTQVLFSKFTFRIKVKVLFMQKMADVSVIIIIKCHNDIITVLFMYELSFNVEYGG